MAIVEFLDVEQTNELQPGFCERDNYLKQTNKFQDTENFKS